MEEKLLRHFSVMNCFARFLQETSHRDLFYLFKHWTNSNKFEFVGLFSGKNCLTWIEIFTSCDMQGLIWRGSAPCRCNVTLHFPNFMINLGSFLYFISCCYWLILWLEGCILIEGNLSELCTNTKFLTTRWILQRCLQYKLRRNENHLMSLTLHFFPFFGKSFSASK